MSVPIVRARVRARTRRLYGFSRPIRSRPPEEVRVRAHWDRRGFRRRRFARWLRRESRVRRRRMSLRPVVLCLRRKFAWGSAECLSGLKTRHEQEDRRCDTSTGDARIDRRFRFADRVPDTVHRWRRPRICVERAYFRREFRLRVRQENQMRFFRSMLLRVGGFARRGSDRNDAAPRDLRGGEQRRAD